MKKSLKIVLVVLIVMVAFLSTSLVLEYNRKKAKLAEEILQQQEEKAGEILAHYSNKVMTSRITVLYALAKIESEKGTEITTTLKGSVGKSVVIDLKEIVPDYTTEYFELADYPGYYISYKDVIPYNEMEHEIFVDTRYQQLIPFNYNVVTNASTNLYDNYDGTGNIYFSLKETKSFPLIVNEDNYYGVDFDNHLLWIKKNEAQLAEHENSTAALAKEVRTFCYHEMYDKSSYSCDKIICHDLSQMRAHFTYLQNNNYYFMSMQDMLWWLNKKIQLPYNSVCLTFDDGGKNTVYLVSLLNEFKIHATLFLIGNVYSDNMISNYLELQSHTYNLHKYGECNILSRGSAFNCRSTSEVRADLIKSRELTNAFAFCYPFYEFTSQRKQLVKDVGFTLAFGDDYGLINQNSDPWLLSRYTCISSTSVSEMAWKLHHD